ncbi:unnamed protein product [Bursaphelenchus okinawaensis]|uniref:WD_REPEATS_REGION domain-containing protein n=1 Tax=Bursaphelenchus okinawaensis TaxID=465554 RepID=A0A811K2Z7_9BILA|nr:unnamed protein product [Bursaphelenchus okinawaensis]CAG9090836.1 unnamed protein product [Bursaphelenchus okinawaensis]
MERVGFGRNKNFNVVQFWEQREIGLKTIAHDRRLIDYRIRSLKMSELELIRYPEDRQSTSSSMAFDQSEYKFLLCGGRTGDIRIFDMDAPENPDTAHAWEHTCYSAPKQQWHHGAITKVQFYPIDSGVFCTTGRDCKVRLYNSETFQVIDEIQLPEPIRDAQWGMAQSKGGIIAVSLGSHSIRLVDPRLRHDIHHLRWPQVTVQSVQFGDTFTSPYVFGGSVKGHCVVWDIRNPGTVMENLVAPYDIIRTKKRKAHTTEIRAIRVTESKKYVVTLSTSKHIHIWDARDLTFIHSLDLTWTPSEDLRQIMEIAEEGQNLYAFVGMGEELLVCNITPKNDRRPNIVKLWRKPKKEEEDTKNGIKQGEKDEQDSNYDPSYDDKSNVAQKDGTMAQNTTEATVNRRRILPRACRKFNTEKEYGNQDVKRLTGHFHNIMSIAYQKHRQRVVTSGADGHTHLWVPAMDETLSDERASSMARLYEDDLSDDDD